MSASDVMRRPENRRALYLVPDLLGLPGGIARHSGLVCRALQDAGAETEVVALHDRADGSTPAGNLTRYVPCDGRRLTFVLRALESARRRPGIVMTAHAHFSMLAWLAARLSGARLVVFAHGIEVWRPLKPLQRWALKRADCIISVSRYSAECMVRANPVEPGKIRVLHTCLDPTLVPSASSALPDPSPNLLTVARISSLEHYKGHEEVLKALPELLKQFPDLVYHIVGDGDDRPHLEARAAACGVGHAVRFHGAVSEAELMAHYARSWVFVMPSRGEGFGLTLLEAMAHGKPVVAGNGDAAREVVKHGETGLLVDPLDLEELTRALSLLLRDAELRRRMGESGARSAAQQFGFDEFRQGLLRLLWDPGRFAEVAGPAGGRWTTRAERRNHSGRPGAPRGHGRQP